MFRIINAGLKEKGLLTADMGCCEDDEPVPLKTWDLETVGIITADSAFWRLEVYIQKIQGIMMKRILLGVYNTPVEALGREDYKKLSDLSTEIYFAFQDFMEQHLEDFEHEGYSVKFYKDGNLVNKQFCDSQCSASFLLNLFGKKYDYAVVTDHETGEKKCYGNKE